jgi:MFS transporter, ACS family, DAL5 transporter family protein
MSSLNGSPDSSPVNKEAGTHVISEHSDSDDEAPEKAAFLGSFSLEEEKKILRKIDHRFLLLIGLMYMIKQVGNPLSRAFIALN